MSAASLASFLIGKLSSPEAKTSDAGDMSGRGQATPTPRLTTVWRTKSIPYDIPDPKQTFRSEGSLLRILRSRSMPLLIREGTTPPGRQAPPPLSYSPARSKSPSPVRHAAARGASTQTCGHLSDASESTVPSLATPPPTPRSPSPSSLRRSRSHSDGHLWLQRRKQVRKDTEMSSVALPSVKNLRGKFENKQTSPRGDEHPDAQGLLEGEEDTEVCKGPDRRWVSRHNSLLRREPKSPERRVSPRPAVTAASVMKRLQEIDDFSQNAVEDLDVFLTPEQQQLRDKSRSEARINVSASEESRDEGVRLRRGSARLRPKNHRRSKSEPDPSSVLRYHAHNSPPSVKKLKMLFEKQDSSHEPQPVSPRKTLREKTPDLPQPHRVTRKPSLEATVTETDGDQGVQLNVVTIVVPDKTPPVEVDPVLAAGTPSVRSLRRRFEVGASGQSVKPTEETFSRPSRGFVHSLKTPFEGRQGRQARSVSPEKEIRESLSKVTSSSVKNLLKQFEALSPEESLRREAPGSLSVGEGSRRSSVKDSPKKQQTYPPDRATEEARQLWGPRSSRSSSSSSSSSDEDEKLDKQQKEKLSQEMERREREEMERKEREAREKKEREERERKEKEENEKKIREEKERKEKEREEREKREREEIERKKRLEKERKEREEKEKKERKEREDKERKEREEKERKEREERERKEREEKMKKAKEEMERQKKSLLQRLRSSSSSSSSSDDEKDDKQKEKMLQEKEIKERERKEIEEKKRKEREERERKEREEKERKIWEEKERKEREERERKEREEMERKIREEKERKERERKEREERERKERERKEREERERKIREENERKEKEERERKEKEEKERKIREEKERKEKEERERKEREERERKEREEKAKKEREREKKEREEKERKEREEKERKEREEKERKKREERERKEREENERKERERAEEERKKREEKERKEREENERKERKRAEEERKKREEAELERKAKEEAARKKAQAKRESQSSDSDSDSSDDAKDTKERKPKVQAIIGLLTEQERREPSPPKNVGNLLQEAAPPSEHGVERLIDQFTNLKDADLEAEAQTWRPPSKVSLDLAADGDVDEDGEGRRMSDVATLVQQFRKMNERRRSSSSSSDSDSGRASPEKPKKEAKSIPTIPTRTNVPGKVRTLRADELRFFESSDSGTEPFMRTQSLRGKKSEPSPFAKPRFGSLRGSKSRVAVLSTSSTTNAALPKNCRRLNTDELRFFSGEVTNIYRSRSIKSRGGRTPIPEGRPAPGPQDNKLPDTEVFFRLAGRGEPGPEPNGRPAPSEDDSDSEPSVLRGGEELPDSEEGIYELDITLRSDNDTDDPSDTELGDLDHPMCLLVNSIQGQLLHPLDAEEDSRCFVVFSPGGFLPWSDDEDNTLTPTSPLASPTLTENVHKPTPTENRGPPVMDELPPGPPPPPPSHTIPPEDPNKPTEAKTDALKHTKAKDSARHHAKPTGTETGQILQTALQTRATTITENGEAIDQRETEVTTRLLIELNDVVINDPKEWTRKEDKTSRPPLTRGTNVEETDSSDEEKEQSKKDKKIEEILNEKEVMVMQHKTQTEHIEEVISERKVTVLRMETEPLQDTRKQKTEELKHDKHEEKMEKLEGMRMETNAHRLRVDPEERVDEEALEAFMDELDKLNSLPRNPNPPPPRDDPKAHMNADDSSNDFSSDEKGKQEKRKPEKEKTEKKQKEKEQRKEEITQQAVKEEKERLETNANRSRVDPEERVDEAALEAFMDELEKLNSIPRNLKPPPPLDDPNAHVNADDSSDDSSSDDKLKQEKTDKKQKEKEKEKREKQIKQQAVKEEKERLETNAHRSRVDPEERVDEEALEAFLDELEKLNSLPRNTKPPPPLDDPKTHMNADDSSDDKELSKEVLKDIEEQIIPLASFQGLSASLESPSRITKDLKDSIVPPRSKETRIITSSPETQRGAEEMNKMVKNQASAPLLASYMRQEEEEKMVKGTIQLTLTSPDPSLLPSSPPPPLFEPSERLGTEEKEKGRGTTDEGRETGEGKENAPLGEGITTGKEETDEIRENALQPSTQENCDIMSSTEFMKFCIFSIWFSILMCLIKGVF